MIRDAHNDDTRIDVDTRLGREGDMSRLIDSRHRLTEIAGVGHTYMYILFGVQVSHMPAVLCFLCANTLMLLLKGGIVRAFWHKQELGEDRGPGNLSCLTGRTRAGIDSDQRGLLYHQLAHHLNHRLGCPRPHQLDHQRICLLLGAGVPDDRQAPSPGDRCKSGTKREVTERAECLAQGTLAKERDPNGARGNNELHLTFRGVDPAPRRGRNVRQ